MHVLLNGLGIESLQGLAACVDCSFAKLKDQKYYVVGWIRGLEYVFSVFAVGEYPFGRGLESVFEVSGFQPRLKCDCIGCVVLRNLDFHYA